MRTALPCLALLRLVLALPFLVACSAQSNPGSLPAPSLDLPAEPKLAPTVITSRGQRLLLSQTDVVVTYDSDTNQLTSNHPGWWIVNYPLERVRNFSGSPANLSQILFNAPLETIKNWYLKTPGTPTAEPAEPTGPAPIEPSRNVSFVVDARAANASDANPGTADEPLRTIAEAVRRAKAGTIIRVNYGVYREAITIDLNGTADQPIIIEGARSAEGLPILDGNDLVPAEAWTPTEWPGVFRSDFRTSLEGSVVHGDQPLIERSTPGELRAGEFATNRASREFVRPRLSGDLQPAEGDSLGGRNWRYIRTDNSANLNLNAIDEGDAAGSVYYASTWVWVEPGKLPFDPAKAAAKTQTSLFVEGSFRAFRASGAPHDQQLNRYRVWVNGAPLASTIYSTASQFELLTPHPNRKGGTEDEWSYFPLREGWNHLMFQLDTTVHPRDLQFSFLYPSQIRNSRSSARTPARLDSPDGGVPGNGVTEYLVLGPFPTQLDRGVYVRLAGDANPATQSLSMAARGTLIHAAGDYIQIRGLEFRHGAQFQQHGQVALYGRGNSIEGSRLVNAEVQGIICRAEGGSSAPPTVIRNNWILDPGNVGFGCFGSSESLTPDNLNINAGTPGRSPVLFEHNYIRNFNWAGFPVGWSAGGSKNVNLTALIFRYNTLIGGSGQGIWLDWETYGNRIEGNLVRNAFQYAIGIEASPGPNLVANNLVVGMRAHLNYNSAMIASWDSSNTWAINNTINGGWNGGKGWTGGEAASGIDLGIGGDRTIRFGPQKNPRQAYLNNIVIGFERALLPRSGDTAQANFSDSGVGGTVLGRAPDFVSLPLDNYQLQPASALNRAGVRNALSDHVLHDFNGLLRHRNLPNSVGAFRNEPAPDSPNHSVIELEFEDGTQRLINASAARVQVRKTK